MKNTYLKGFNEAYEKLEADLKERYPQISSANYSVFKSRFVQERHLDFSNEFCQGTRYKDVLPLFEAQLFKNVKEVGLPSFEESYHISKSEIIVSYSQGENGKKLIDVFFEHGDDHIVYDLGRMAAWTVFGMRTYAVCTWIDFEEESGRPVVLQSTNENGIIYLESKKEDAMKCLIVGKYEIKKTLGDIIKKTEKEETVLGIYCRAGYEGKFKKLINILVEDGYLSTVLEEIYCSHINGGFPEEKLNWESDLFILVYLLDHTYPFLKNNVFSNKNNTFLFQVAQQHFTLLGKELESENSWVATRSINKNERINDENLKKIDRIINSL